MLIYVYIYIPTVIRIMQCFQIKSYTKIIWPNNLAISRIYFNLCNNVVTYYNVIFLQNSGVERKGIILVQKQWRSSAFHEIEGGGDVMAWCTTYML